jgi:hypothetical protein
MMRIARVRNAAALSVNADDGVSLLQEMLRDGVTDALRGARNQNLHALFVLSV